MVYRSPLEKRIHSLIPKYEYEKEKLPYSIERNYIPDFVDKDKKILIEAKGFFRDGDDRKYKAIRRCYPDWRMIFVFTDPKKPVRKGGVPRKDGTRLSLGEWATQNGWEYCDEYTIPEDLK